MIIFIPCISSLHNFQSEGHIIYFYKMVICPQKSESPLKSTLHENPHQSPPPYIRVSIKIHPTSESPLHDESSPESLPIDQSPLYITVGLLRAPIKHYLTSKSPPYNKVPQS